jgi:hypothetical protein
MPAVLRVVLARIIGALLGGLVAWLAGKGIQSTQANVDLVISALLTIFTIVYGLVHTDSQALDINPGRIFPSQVAQLEKRLLIMAALDEVAANKARHDTCCVRQSRRHSGSGSTTIRTRRSRSRCGSSTPMFPSAICARCS